LVHWEDIDTEHATWEELTYMQQVYPDFNLEDKVDFDGRNNVTSGNSTRAILKKCKPKANSGMKDYA